MNPLLKKKIESTIEKNLTANYTVNKLIDNGVIFTNAGASGTITVTLPTATTEQTYKFRTTAAEAINIDCQSTDTIQNISTAANAAGQYTAMAGTGNEWAEVVCREAGKWIVTEAFGTLTDE
jgi:hypothetical protein